FSPVDTWILRVVRSRPKLRSACNLVAVFPHNSAPTFIPSTEDLNKVERDLRFHPSTVTDPKTLTAEQVAAFNRDGYLKGIRIFTTDEIADIRLYFDDL